MKLAKVLAGIAAAASIIYFGWAMEDRYAPTAELIRVEKKDDKYHAKKDYEEAQKDLWRFEDR